MPKPFAFPKQRQRRPLYPQSHGGSMVAASAKPKYNPSKVLAGFDTNKPLSGQDLIRAARAMTALETRPQLHGYKQLANQLKTERNIEAKGLGALGERLQTNTTDVYKNIAVSEADSLARQQSLGQMLNQQSGAIAQQGTQDLTQMQQGQLGDYTQGLQMRGAPGGGSAQQELANAVASQQASQVANNGAAQNLASSQASAFGQLGAGLAGSAQLQGGEAVAGIGRDIISRTASSNQKYREGIQTALGKLADVKATKGPSMIKNLLELRGGEQKYQLGRAAVRREKAKLAAEATQDAAANTIAQQKADAATTSAGASALNAATSAWEARHPGATPKERQKNRKEVRLGIGEIKSTIPLGITHFGAAPKTVDQLNKLAEYVNTKTSASPTLVHKVLKHWWVKNKPLKASGSVHLGGS